MIVSENMHFFHITSKEIEVEPVKLWLNLLFQLPIENPAKVKDTPNYDFHTWLIISVQNQIKCPIY